MTKWLNQRAAISWRSNSRPAAQRSARLERDPPAYSPVFIENCGTGVCGWENSREHESPARRCPPSESPEGWGDHHIPAGRDEKLLLSGFCKQQPAGCVGAAAGCRPADETLPDLSGRRRTQMRIYQIYSAPREAKKAAAPFAEVFGQEVSTIDLTDASMDFFPDLWTKRTSYVVAVPLLWRLAWPSRRNGWSASAPTAQWPFWWWPMETGPMMTRCWN